MRSAELFKKYKIEIGGTNAVLKNEFGLALTEYKKEIIGLIDEMIDDRYMKLQSIDLREPNELNDAIAEVWQYQIDELTELRNKLGD